MASVISHSHPIVVTKLLIHPVKSCRGISVDEAEIMANGFKYDRQWLIVDENLRFCTARELPQLVLVNTEIKGSDLIITVPPPASNPTTPPTVITIPLEPSVSDLQALPLLTEVIIWGSHIDAHAVSPKADKAFSDFLGKPVRLVRLASEEEGGRIRIGSDEIIGKERLDVVSKLQDVYPYTIATMQSLNAVKSSINASKSVDRTKWPSSRVDGFAIERFRPNVVVDGPDLAPWEEDSWEHVAFCRRASSPSGEHTTTEEQFYVPGRMPRCLLTGVCPETGEADKIVPYGVLSTYRRVDPGFSIKPCFAVSAVPISPGGVLRVGDTLRIISTLDPAERIFGLGGQRVEVV